MKKLGYEQAVQLKIYEGSLVWSRSQTMLVANTVILAAISIFLDSENPNVFTLIPLSGLGILLSIIWLENSIRGFAFNKFWSLSIRNEEEKLTDIKLMKEGARFRDNKEVEFDFKDANGLKKRYKRPFLGRLFNTEIGLYILIVVFIVIYVALLILALTGNVKMIRV